MLDKNPLFTKYLRTLFMVSAILIVLNPFSRARDILYLIPTFSLLAGLNYEIVVRRHGQMLCRLLRWAATAAFAANTGALLFIILPVDGLRLIPFLAALKYGKGVIILVGETLHISHFNIIDNIRRDLGAWEDHDE